MGRNYRLPVMQIQIREVDWRLGGEAGRFVEVVVKVEGQ